MKRLHEMAQGKPDELVAIHDFDGNSYRYGELNQLADEIAISLTQYGVRGGDRLILMAENCALYAAVILAASRMDVWLTLLNARVTQRELDDIAAHSQARCIVFTVYASGNAKEHADQNHASVISSHACGDLVVSPLRAVVPEPVIEGAEQVATLLYTSGTSGAPKGVMLTHANMLFMSQTSAKLRNISAKDSYVGVLPGTHIFFYSSVLLSGLYSGASIYMLPRFSIEAVMSVLAKGATLLPAVPQMYALLLRCLEQQGVTHFEHRLRFMSSGGAPLDPSWKAHVESVFGLTLQNGYGLTEASPGVCTTRPHEKHKDTCVGKAFPGMDIKLHEPNEQGIGELWVRGPNVMKGYYKNPQATAEAITAEGWLRTGDLARMTADESIYIVGRSKEVIIHSGFNVYPPEVEAVLNTHPMVVAAAVVGRVRNSNEDVMAFCQVKAPIEGSVLQEWARERLSAYKVPYMVIAAEVLPHASTNKILKNKLITYFAAEIAQIDKDRENHA